MAENDHLPLTWHIALTTVYALTCYTVIFTVLGIFTAIGLQLFIRFISQLKKDRFGTGHGRMYAHGYMLRNAVMQDGGFM